MIAVIFEVWPAEGHRDDYLGFAAWLRNDLARIDDFRSVGPRDMCVLMIMTKSSIVR
jgi:hypothetical protein